MKAIRKNVWLIIALIAFALLSWWSVKESIHGTRIEYVDRVKSDTVTIERTDTIFIVQEAIKSVHHWDTVYQDTVIFRNVPVVASRYIDSVALNNAMLHYNIAVVGELYSTDFRLVSKVPEINRTITQTITNTVTRYPSGLYATVGFNTGIGPGAGALLLHRRWAFGYQYYFNKTHTAQLGYRIR